jgi:hypothetical protein
MEDALKFDEVNRPAHYASHESGVEAIELTARMSFCLGNAAKYVFRADGKGSPLTDWRKALWYAKRARDSFGDASVLLRDDVRKEAVLALGRYLAVEGESVRGHVIGLLCAAEFNFDDRQAVELAIDLIEREVGRLEMDIYGQI